MAGPFEYTLERGSVTGGNPQAWFLRSALDCALVPTLPGCVGPKPPTPPPPIADTPHFRQEVSLYAAMPVAAAVYGLRHHRHLHERMGGDAQVLGPGDDGTYDGTPDGAWGRLIGHWGHRDGAAASMAADHRFDYGFGALQAGLDLYRAEGQDGSRDNAGLYAAFGHGEVDVEHNLLGLITIKGGEDKFDAWSLGGYWTHFGPSDWYLDGVSRRTWYDAHDDRTAGGLRDGETDGWGLAASLEGGYPFDLGNGWLIEPQAQLVYQMINLNDFNDGAADVRYSDTNSLAGRIGARLARSWDLEEAQGDGPSESGAPRAGAPGLGMAARPTSGTSSSASRRPSSPRHNGFVPFTADLEGSWMKVGLGGTYDFATTPRSTATSTTSGPSTATAYAWEGKLGVKVTW